VQGSFCKAVNNYFFNFNAHSKINKYYTEGVVVVVDVVVVVVVEVLDEVVNLVVSAVTVVVSEIEALAAVLAPVTLFKQLKNTTTNY